MKFTFKEDYKFEIVPFGSLSKNSILGFRVTDVDGKTDIPYDDFVEKYGVDKILLSSTTRLKHDHKCVDIDKSFMKLSLAYIDYNHSSNNSCLYVRQPTPDVNLIFCLKCNLCGHSVTLDEFETELREIAKLKEVI